MSNHKVINSDLESRREQPQGESTAQSQPHGDGVLTRHLAEMGGQTEGGEKPRCRGCGKTEAEHSPEETCFEPASPPAPPAAGMTAERDIDMKTLRDHLSVEDYRLVLKVRDAFAKQQVREAIVITAKTCAEESAKHYSTLKAEVAQLRQERDVWESALREAIECLDILYDKYEDGVACHEMADDDDGAYIGNAIMLTETEESRILASLKSSEGAK